MKALVQSGLALGRGPIARGSMVSLAVRLAGIGLSFAQAVLTARLLGAAGYGTTAVALSIAQIGATALQLGLGPLAVKTISQRLAAGDTGGVRRFVRHSLTVVGGLSLVSIGLPAAVLALSPGEPSGIELAILLGTIAIAPFAFLLLLRGIAQGLGNVGLAQWPGEVLRPGLLVAIMLAVAASGIAFGPVAFLAAVIGSATVAALAACVAALRLLNALPDSSLQETAASPALGMALPFLGIGLVAILQGEMATLMLGSLATAEQTGLFQPVARLAPLVVLPMNAMAMSYTPRFAELWQRGECERATRATHMFTLTAFAAGIAIFLAIYLLAPFILGLFGPEFEAVTPLLRIFAAGQLFVAACGPAGAIITMIGRSRDALWAFLAGLVLQIALGVVLIPQSGAYGAVISLTAGTALAWLLMLLAARKAGGFDPSLITVATRLQAFRQSPMDRPHD
jgi:O-antigen/teichoic acid export membrane protein